MGDLGVRRAPVGRPERRGHPREHCLSTAQGGATARAEGPPQPDASAALSDPPRAPTREVRARREKPSASGRLRPRSLSPPTQAEKEDSPHRQMRAVGKNPGSDLLSHRVAPAVPSALESLTSVFGMGTGVASPELPPGKKWRSTSGKRCADVRFRLGDWCPGGSTSRCAVAIA